MSIGLSAGLLTGANYDVRADDGLTISAIMLLFAVSAGLVWTHRDERRPLTLMARTAVLWSSFGYAWVIGYGELLSWFADTTSIAAGASLVAGAAVYMGRRAWLRLRRRDGDRGAPQGTMLDVFTPVPGPYHTPV